MSNNFNNINISSYNDILSKQFLNYIYYELSYFEKILKKEIFL